MQGRGRTSSSNGVQTFLFCPATPAAVLARVLSLLCLGLFALARAEVEEDEEEGGEYTRYSFSPTRIPTCLYIRNIAVVPWLHTLSLI